MCNVGAASLGMQAASGMMSTVGAVFGAKSQKSALNHQAGMADINAKIHDMNARELIRSGIVEESRIKLRGAQAKSSQVAQMAGSGIDIAGSPTALARLTGSDVITEVDAQTLRGNALRAAWGQRFEAGNERRKGMSLRASAASISPFMSGLTTFMTSASQVASSWYTMGKEGAFTKKKEPTTTGQAALYSGTGQLQPLGGGFGGW